MKNPLILSLVQLTRPDGRTLVVAAVLWSLVGFIALWSGVTWSINYFDPFSSSWSSVLFGWLSSVISLVFTILLFPALMFMAIGLFQERAAGIVEAAHYPNFDSPRQSSIVEQARLGVRFRSQNGSPSGMAGGPKRHVFPLQMAIGRPGGGPISVPKMDLNRDRNRDLIHDPIRNLICDPIRDRNWDRILDPNLDRDRD